MTSSIRMICRRLRGALTALAGVALSQQALAVTQCVNAGAPAPLEICVQDNGTPGVWVSQPDGRRHQYFGSYSWGSSIRLGQAGQTFHTGYFSGAGSVVVTPVSNTTAGSGTAADPFIITTVVALGGSGVQLTQRFRYVNGDRYFSKIWTIENTGGTSHGDLRFFHGGDTYFGGNDSARSWYDADLRMVYVNNSGFSNSGYMAFYANPLTPLSHYFSGQYSTGRSQVVAGALNDTFNSNFLDAGYYLQWNREELRPGETWRIEAFETWSPPGSLQVLTPGDEYVTPGATLRKIFKIHNLSDTTPVSVTLAASTTSGWSLALPDGMAATLAPLQVVEVPVDVQVPAHATAGESADIVLDVTDGALNTMRGTTRLRIPSTDYSFSTRVLDFGTAPIHAQAELVITFTNGSGPVSLGQAGAANPLVAPFSIVADTCSNATLAARATCAITVRFAPAVAAQFTDSFGIPVGGEALVNETLSVTGESVDQVILSATAGEGGSITPTDLGVPSGATASFTLVPDTGYRIGAVSGCGGTLAGDVYTTGSITAACAVTASFERIVLALAVNAGAGGSVSPQVSSVPYGDTATFVITPAHGHVIGSVSGCAGTLTAGGFTTGPVTAACTLSVTFVEQMSDVIVRGSGKGGGGSFELFSLGGLLLLALRRLRRAGALAAMGVAVAGGAQAGQPAASGLHAGASIAAATSSESGRDISRALQARGHAVTASLDDRRTAWRLHGGWSLNRYLAAEIGYSDLGEVSTDHAGSVPVLAVDDFLAAAADLHPRSANGFDLSVVGRYPLPFAPRLSIHARAGLFRWDAQRRASASDGRSVVRHEDGASLLLGGGVGHALTRNADVFAEWTRHALGSEQVQALGMGVRYRW